MKRLYLARHGQAVVNTVDGIGGDDGLTDLGREQAHIGGQKAADEDLKLDLIISSPLVRARETAEIFAEELGYPRDKIVISDLFAELWFGELEGTSWQAFTETGTLYQNLGDYKGAETIEALQERADRALDYLQHLPENDILVVAHGIFGRALMRAVKGLPYTDEFTNGASLPHAQIIQLL